MKIEIAILLSVVSWMPHPALLKLVVTTGVQQLCKVDAKEFLRDYDE